MAGDDEGWQMLLNENLANIDSARGEYRRAVERLRFSIALAEKLGEKPREAICRDALGDVWLKDGRLDELGFAGEVFGRRCPFLSGRSLRASTRVMIGIATTSMRCARARVTFAPSVARRKASSERFASSSSGDWSNDATRHQR